MKSSAHAKARLRVDELAVLLEELADMPEERPCARGPDQTDLVYRVARPRSLKDRLILQAMEGQFRTAVLRDSATLIELAAADPAERAAGRATEPDLPASTTRHLSATLAATGGPIAYLPET